MHTISWTSGWNLVELTDTSIEGRKKWLDFADFYLIFKVWKSLYNVYSDYKSMSSILNNKLS